MQAFVVYTDITNINLIETYEKLCLSDHILSVRYKNQMKGLVRKRREPKRLLNCIYVWFHIGNINVNMKVFQGGTLQLSGCKSIEDCKLCVYFLWREISDGLDTLNTYIISTLRNYLLDGGYKICLEKIEAYLLNSNYSIRYYGDARLGRC